MSRSIHGGQKFITRNRPPRVTIAVDEEIEGGKIKINLPFVAGVMADLSGNWQDPEEVEEKFASARGELSKRKFLEIGQGNFNERMQAIQPTVSFNIPNTLTGEGNHPVNLTFSSMEDFSPDKIAEKWGPAKELYEARKALKYLQSMASNRADLEKVLQKLSANPALTKALVEAATPPPA